MSLKNKQQLDNQTADIEAQPNKPVPTEESGVATCPLTDAVEEINITAKIDAEYKVALLDKNLSSHQEPSEEKVVTDSTEVELWLEQDHGSPEFDQGAKIDISGPGTIDAFLDKEMTTTLNTRDLIPKDKITGGKKLKVWVKGTKAGKFTLKLTPSRSANGKFIIQPPAEMEMGVVELKMEIYEQDVSSIASIHVDPDKEPISDYHTALDAKALPDQIVLSDENKIKKGRLLHVQNDTNFGRSKVIIKALTADQFPGGCDSYDITLNSGGKSGQLKLFDAEFDGTEVTLPLKVKKSDLTADKTYWVEGASETNALKEAVLDLGLNRASGGMAKTPKRNGDWGRYSIVKIDNIELDYTQPTGGPNAWDATNKRFFINMQTGTAGRTIKIKAKLSKALKDVTVHFMLVEDKNNRKTANWGVDLPNDPRVHKWIWKDITANVKYLDKTDRKDLLHYSVKTDVKGEVSKEVILSQFGGDTFYLAAYIEQDPHLAKYIHDHATLGKRKPVMATNEINVWRKFWYQEVKVEGVTVAGFGNAADCYDDVKAVMEAATPVVEMPRTTADALSPPVIYPKHMLSYYQDPITLDMKNNYPNDTSDGLMVGDDNESAFFALATLSTERPVVVPMMNVNGLWIADGNTTRQNFGWEESGFPHSIITDKQLLDPPIQGGDLLVQGRLQLQDWDSSGTGGWINNRVVNLTATDVSLNPARDHPNELQVNKPASVIMATKTRFKILGIEVKGATNFLGTSYSDGILNSYTPNDVQDFINTINHELGHSFKQVAKSPPSGIPAHPKQYDSQGSHCSYKNQSCLMYENGPQPAALNRYCPVCHPHVLVQDMSTV